MRIILITGEDPGHRYVANRLASEVELAGIIVDRGTGRRRWRRLWKRYTLGQLASRACVRFLTTVRRDGIRRRNRMLEILGAQRCGDLLFPHLVTSVHGINSTEGVNLVSSLQPDVILVFGTGVVKERILSLARNVALNLHTGISPYYRGADCTLWPLYNNELQMLGATIHKCTMQLDGGFIFATGRARLHEDDDLDSVFARCVMVGADLYVKVVKDVLAGKLEGNPQDLSIGREYKGVMWNVRADLKIRRQIRNGLVRRYVLGEGGGRVVVPSCLNHLRAADPDV
jgi:methionyl-tRNA formyltransferase